MPFPFRNPVSYEDDENQDWTPPDYAKASSTEETGDKEWKPPDYAKAATKKEEKPSVFSRVKEALKPAERIHATASLSPHNLIKKALDTEYGKRILLSQDPTSEPLSPSMSELGIKEPTTYWGGFAKGLVDYGRELFTSPGGIAGLISGEEAVSPSKGVAKELPIRRRKASEAAKILEGEIIPDKTPQAVVTPTKINPKKEEEPKKTFVNPFELPQASRIDIENPNLDRTRFPEPEAETKPVTKEGSDDILYDIARKKFNMGKDLPKTEEWTPPDYAKPSEEPQAARTGSGKLAIGADVKSLGKVLGTSLYKGDIAPIATKELLQNSVDAVRHLGSEGKIDVAFDKAKNIIHVSDNGKGLTKKELETVFTDLGASGKREDASAAGGFGLAKAAPLLGGERVEVTTVAREKNGLLTEHKFSGTPDELLQGVDIQSTIKPEGTPTGTTVQVKVPKNSDFYSSQKFVENLKSNSPEIKAKIRHGDTYGTDVKSYKDFLDRREKVDSVLEKPREPKPIATLDNPSATTHLMESGNSKRRNGMSMNLHLSNNGMYQGTKPMYFENSIPNLPSDVIVDIRPKVPEGHGDYPFTANREELRGTVEAQVKKYVDENIVKPNIGKRLEELKKLYSGMDEISVGKGEFPNNFGHKIALYDPKGQISPTEMQEIKQNPFFHTLAANIAGTLKEAMKTAGTLEWNQRLEKIGIIFDDQLHGIHIPNPGTGKSAILINPFTAIGKMSPDEASANILHTILHEMAHVEPEMPGHNESFTIRLGDIYGKFGARRSIEAQDNILKSIANPNTGVYHPEIQKLLQTYQESRGRAATTEDLLSGTGIGSKTEGGGKGDISRSDRRTPERVSTAVNKLFSAIQESKGLNAEQEALYKAERAKRFAAFNDVKAEGMEGAAKSLSKLKGEYEKVQPTSALSQEDADSLFTAVKKSNITAAEKARGYTALFKLVNGEKVPQRNELAILDNVFGNGFADKIVEMHGGLGAVGLKLSKVANTMKSLQNAISLAAPLRHGIGLAARKEFYPAFADMFRFFGNKEYYDAAMKAIEERPNYLLGRDAGLFIAKNNSLLNSEEEFLNSYAGNIPIARNLVGASQRAYTGFLNKLRADTFDSMIETAKRLGHDVSIEESIYSKKHPDIQVDKTITATKESKAIARYINNATGRGDLPGGLNKMTNELNTLLWSPRMISSRLNMLANPKIYTDLPKGMRMEGLKSLLGIAAIGTIIDTMNALAGAKITTNILSSDFMKGRYGKDVIDPWGGFQQYVVNAARFLAGFSEQGKKDIAQARGGTPNDNTPLKTFGNFLASKESPAAAFAHSMLTAKKFTGGGDYITQYGQKTSIDKEIEKTFTPILIQDLMNIVDSDPDWAEHIGLTAVMTAGSLTGMSQSYPEKRVGGLKFRKMTNMRLR